MTALPVVGQRIRIRANRYRVIAVVDHVDADPNAATSTFQPQSAPSCKSDEDGGVKPIRATAAVSGVTVYAYADQWEPLPDYLTVGELADLLVHVDRDMPVAVLAKLRRADEVASEASEGYGMATEAWVLRVAAGWPGHEANVARFVIERKEVTQ